jgi:hypothetical protein
MEIPRCQLCSRYDFLPGDILRGLLIDDDLVGVFAEPGEKPWQNLRYIGAIRPGNDGCGFLRGLGTSHREKEIVQKINGFTTEDTEYTGD